MAGKCNVSKRTGLCAAVSLILAVALVVVLFVVIRSPEDISTEERNDSFISDGDLTLTKVGYFVGEVSGRVTLGQLREDGSHWFALNDFAVDSICDALEFRLSATGETGFSFPITSDITQADITEEIGIDAQFDPKLYDQATIWCTSTAEQLGTPAILSTPLPVAGEGNGTAIVEKQGSFVGTDYTTEGLIQIVTLGSLVDGILVTSYTLLFTDIDVSPGPDVVLYLTTDPLDPEDVDAEGSLKVLLSQTPGGSFSFTGNFNEPVPDEFENPQRYVAAVVWCDQFNALFGSAILEEP
ncbi:unnamed protein product [Discosporangium mesarthrocarpum]